MNLERLRCKLALSLTMVAAAAAATVARTPSAQACGCFAQSNPGVPIVQAGERIVFAMEDGNVVAHIQIQYSGNPGEFGWLVPLPSLPNVELGTDELFTQIINATQPVYNLNVQDNEYCPVSSFPLPAPAPPSRPSPDEGPLVFAAEIGPYSYAVLEADAKQQMLDWLTENGYFIAADTDAAVDPYIRPGGYFLAVKLQSGADVGELQPIVLRYPSELPMIPIVLTSVGALDDMPVLVWVLGEHRAIPRNFYHTLINDALIDWRSRGANYIDVVTRAVDQADGHHAFITEYAGPSDIMIDRIAVPTRFGTREELVAQTDAIEYLRYLASNGFASSNSFSPQFLAILARHLPPPPAYLEAGYSAQQYYRGIDYVAETLANQQPELFVEWDLEFDPVALTDELYERIVTPTRNAEQLFSTHPYLTRMFTTLSPTEMTKDPVFSFNPDLPDVSNVHTAQLVYVCEPPVRERDAESPYIIITEQGWELYAPNGRESYDWLSVPLPPNLSTQVLREEGAPEVVDDNAEAIQQAILDHRKPYAPSSGGCALAPGARKSSGLGSALAMAFLGICLAAVRRRHGRWRKEK